MVKGFWKQLPRPFFCLAPLHDVTDAAFRRMVARHGKPDVMFTEFVSTDGLVNSKSREKMLRRYLGFTEAERPIIAQIWGTKPCHFTASAELLAEMGFDGIDINMGCPEKSAVKTGACAALIGTPRLAQEIIRATVAGAGTLPVSVKTRIGLDKISYDTWIPYLLEMQPAALTIHGRTQREMSRVPAHWDVIGHIAQMARGSGTLIVGNGDIKSIADGLEKVKKYGVDGVMVGRGIFDNHWLYARERKEPPTIEERLGALIEHAQAYEEHFGAHRSFHVLRKHFSAYASGFAGAKELRMALMRAASAREVETLIQSWMSAQSESLPARL